MYRIYFDLFWIETAIAILLVIWYGFVAATENDGPRKGNAYLIASLAFSSWFCISPLLRSLYDAGLPVFEFEGTISSVHVHDSTRKRYSANVQIHTTLGGDIDVHVSDRSDALRVGQNVKVRYRGDTGELISATFFGADGKQNGALKSTSNFQRTLSILLGLFLIWASLRKFRRDPECAEETGNKNPDLLGSVDEESLIDLSELPPRHRL